MTALQGCGTALVTPFRAGGALDRAALERLVEWQVEEGVDFLLACGSTGEAQTLTPEERTLVVQSAVRIARGRAPVVAGATDNDTSRALAEARRMCDAGADYILSACPPYNKPSQEGLRRHFEAIADASSRPVILYNIPGRSAVNLLPSTTARLAQHPNIAGLKDSCGDMHQALEMLALRPAGFLVFAGDDWIALPLILAGAEGLISVASNAAPALMARLVRAARAGRLDEGRELGRMLLPLMDVHFIESNPAPIKAGLALQGRIENVLRLPLVPVSDASLARIRSEYERAGILHVEAGAHA